MSWVALLTAASFKGAYYTMSERYTVLASVWQGCVCVT